MLLLGLLTLGIVAAVLIVLALLPARPGVTKANFDRIKVGMTQAEVEAIFGAKPIAVGPREGLCEWQSDSNDLAIILCDAEGIVVTAEWDGWPDERSPMEKLLDTILRRERRKIVWDHD